MFIQTAALAAISLLLSALTCPMPAQAASELTTIRIAHNGFSSEIPFYVGKDAGIFVKHGFNVEPIFIVGGSTTIQALIGKSLDLLMGGATPMLSAVINGAQLKIIGGMNNRIPFALLSQPVIRRSHRSVIGDCRSHRSPRLTVNFWLTRMSSCR